MEGNSKDVIAVVSLGLILRCCVSLFPYSGAGVPPMYGDYEAQRHWQEITVNLPISEWYQDTEENDLQYWGLDYPPLTAYHSWVVGIIAEYINYDYVALFHSRGYESQEHKLFMRLSVLIADLLIYIPALLILYKASIPSSEVKFGSFSCLSALMLYPGLYLIDYGHFQYNNISLGLFILAVAFIYKDRDYASSFLFTLALNYKQMELYHSLPFFFYLLGKNFDFRNIRRGVYKIALIGCVVITTLIACWCPFLMDFELLTQVISRVFPINRGLYEDKVASVWCSMSIFFKFQNILTKELMAKVCLFVTSLLVLPSSIHLYFKPKPTVFKYSLINISLIFFLFSYHVHEKSILLAAIPACLVFNEEPLVVSWFLIVSVFSMFPLLIKDGLLMPSVASIGLLFFLYYFSSKEDVSKFSFSRMVSSKLLFYFSLGSFLALSLVGILFEPPKRYPDLYPVILSFYSCLHFSVFSLYFHYCQFSVANCEKVKLN